jgi:hypothetical protein
MCKILLLCLLMLIGAVTAPAQQTRSAMQALPPGWTLVTLPECGSIGLPPELMLMPTMPEEVPEAVLDEFGFACIPERSRFFVPKAAMLGDRHPHVACYTQTVVIKPWAFACLKRDPMPLDTCLQGSFLADLSENGALSNGETLVSADHIRDSVLTCGTAFYRHLKKKRADGTIIHLHYFIFWNGDRTHELSFVYPAHLDEEWRAAFTRMLNTLVIVPIAECYRPILPFPPAQ